MRLKDILLPIVGFAVGSAYGYFLRSKVNERRMENFMDISEIEVFCKNHHCDTCPLLDKKANCCVLHAELPADWNDQLIFSTVRKESRNGYLTGKKGQNSRSQKTSA